MVHDPRNIFLRGYNRLFTSNVIPSPSQERVSDDHFIKDHRILLYPSFLYCFYKATSSRWTLKGSGER